MHIIGLTGGIASGKSTVTTLLRDLGAAIIDADVIARKVVEPGEPVWQNIVKEFGPEFLLPGGKLDRKKLGDLVFANKDKRQILDDITHPRVKQEINDRLEGLRQSGVKAVVLDIPLLIEVGWQHMADTVWVVYVDRETQLRRLVERDKLNREDAIARIHSQMCLDDKVKYADVLIDNSKDLDYTRKQVLAAWDKITGP